MRPPPPCSSSRCVVATVQPLFSPPTSANAGTRTSSKNTVCLTPLSVPPSPPVPISSIGCMLMPGRFASIMNHERFSWRRPFGAVQAISQMRSAPLSLPTKILALDHVIVAVAYRRRHPHASEIRPGAGLGQELPGAHLAAIDRRQERLPLLLRAPD